VCAATVMRCAFDRVTVATWMASRSALSSARGECASAAAAQGLVGGSAASPGSGAQGRGQRQAMDEALLARQAAVLQMAMFT